MFDEIN